MTNEAHPEYRKEQMQTEMHRTEAYPLAPGEWRKVTVDGEPNAVVACPNCGYRAL